MYSATETVGLELKYFAKDDLAKGLGHARGTLTKFANFAHSIADKVKAAFRAMWTAATGPVGMLAGGVGIMGAGYGIFSFLKGTLAAANQWEMMQAKMTVALKDAKKTADMFAWLAVVQEKFPFPLEEIIDATIRLEMYGLSAKKWLPLVSDMAGAMGRSILDSTEAVADAVVGETERLKEFGLQSYVLVSKYGAMAGPAGGMLTATPAGRKAAEGALERAIGERFAGGSAKMMTTWTGIVSNLSTVWTALKRSIGQGFLPVLKSIVFKTMEWIQLLNKAGIGEKLGKKLGEGLEWAWKKVLKLYDYLEKHGPSLWEKAKEKAIDFFSKALHGGAQLLIWAADFRATLEAVWASFEYVWTRLKIEAKPVLDWLGDTLGSLVDFFGRKIAEKLEILQNVKIAGMAIVTKGASVIGDLRKKGETWQAPKMREKTLVERFAEVYAKADLQAKWMETERRRQGAWVRIGQNEWNLQSKLRGQVTEPPSYTPMGMGMGVWGGGMAPLMGEWYQRYGPAGRYGQMVPGMTVPNVTRPQTGTFVPGTQPLPLTAAEKSHQLTEQARELRRQEAEREAFRRGVITGARRYATDPNFGG